MNHFVAETWPLVAALPWANIFAAVSAAAAAWAVLETRVATRAQLVGALIDEYAKSEMKGHLRCLTAWRDSNGPEFAKKWIEKLKAHDSEASEVDEARRYVKGYFEKSARLHLGKFLNKSSLRLVALRYGINIYYDVVCPLEDALNNQRDTMFQKLLNRVVGRYVLGKPQF